MKLPLLSGKQALAALQRLGFVEVHRGGSHVKMQHPDGRIVVFPFHDEIDRYTLRGCSRFQETGQAFYAVWPKSPSLWGFAGARSHHTWGDFLLQPYSWRSAMMGSTRAVTAMNVRGSAGPTPKSMARSAHVPATHPRPTTAERNPSIHRGAQTRKRRCALEGQKGGLTGMGGVIHVREYTVRISGIRRRTLL